MAKPRIQIVEDDSITAQYLKRSLENHSYEVFPTVFYGEEAIEVASKKKPDLVLMDINLPGNMDGVDAAREIISRFDIPVVYLTAYYDATTVDRTKITGAYGYIIKPVDVKSLFVVIETALSKHQMERELKENRRWLATILNSIGDAVITTDTQGYIKFMNPAAETLTGWKQTEALGKELAEVLGIVDENTGEKIEDPVKTALREKKPAPLFHGYKVLTAKDGQKIPVYGGISPLMDADGNLIGAVITFRDGSERRRMEETLRTLSWIDGLTELYNRRGFIHMAEYHLKLANRTKKKLFLFYADLDDLKLINDTHGHPEGDQALIDTAGIFREAFRGSDVIARFGGDEFVVLLPETVEKTVEGIKKRLLGKMAALNNRKNRKYPLSVSIGISGYDPNEPTDIQELIRSADQLMYKDKKKKNGS